MELKCCAVTGGHRSVRHTREESASYDIERQRKVVLKLGLVLQEADVAAQSGQLLVEPDGRQAEVPVTPPLPQQYSRALRQEWNR